MRNKTIENIITFILFFIIITSVCVFIASGSYSLQEIKQGAKLYEARRLAGDSVPQPDMID